MAHKYDTQLFKIAATKKEDRNFYVYNSQQLVLTQFNDCYQGECLTHIHKYYLNDANLLFGEMLRSSWPVLDVYS